MSNEISIIWKKVEGSNELVKPNLSMIVQHVWMSWIRLTQLLHELPKLCMIQLLIDLQFHLITWPIFQYYYLKCPTKLLFFVSTYTKKLNDQTHKISTTQNYSLSLSQCLSQTCDTTPSLPLWPSTLSLWLLTTFCNLCRHCSQIVCRRTWFQAYNRRSELRKLSDQEGKKMKYFLLVINAIYLTTYMTVINYNL